MDATEVGVVPVSRFNDGPKSVMVGMVGRVGHGLSKGNQVSRRECGIIFRKGEEGVYRLLAVSKTTAETSEPSSEPERLTGLPSAKVVAKVSKASKMLKKPKLFTIVAAGGIV